jgi:pimeloyl-ACP methyl ester carboxylesterase
MKLRFVLLLYCIGTCALAQPINKDEVISIGGIRQFVRFDGVDRTKPLLLFLHGGPGGSMLSYANKFTKQLQEHFVVIQWDQRESGETLVLNKSPETLTAELFQNDTRQLIDTLLKRFNREKLFLAGYSWGTYLGFQQAKNHPEQLYAYLAISPMINQWESERLVLDRMKGKAIAAKSEEELKELNTIQFPFQNGEQLYLQRKHLLEYMGMKKPISRDYVLSWSATWLSVYNKACDENLIKSLPKINCPVFFFTGRRDYQTSFEITESYYNRLDAPLKDLFWFEHSAHAIPTTEPALLQETIINKVLPVVKLSTKVQYTIE